MISLIATNFETIPNYLNRFIYSDRMSRQLGLVEFELKLFRIKLLPKDQCILISLAAPLL